MKSSDFYRELDKYYEQDNAKDVENFLKKCVEENKPQPGELSPLWISAMNELGSFYRGTSKYEQSVDAFRQAAQEVRRFIGANSLEYATVLNNIGGALRMMKEFEAANSNFLLALDIYNNQRHDDPFGHASVCNNLALCQQSMNRIDEALSFFERSLSILKSAPDSNLAVATACGNIAALFFELGNTEQAKKKLNEAFAVFETVDCTDDPHYGATLNTLASIYYLEGKFSEAAEVFSHALKIVRSNFGENAEYAEICLSLARAFESEGKRLQAEEYALYACEVFATVLTTGSAKYQEARAYLENLQSALEGAKLEQLHDYENKA